MSTEDWLVPGVNSSSSQPVFETKEKFSITEYWLKWFHWTHCEYLQLRMVVVKGPEGPRRARTGPEMKDIYYVHITLFRVATHAILSSSPSWKHGSFSRREVYRRNPIVRLSEVRLRWNRVDVWRQDQKTKEEV